MCEPVLGVVLSGILLRLDALQGISDFCSWLVFSVATPYKRRGVGPKTILLFWPMYRPSGVEIWPAHWLPGVPDPPRPGLPNCKNRRDRPTGGGNQGKHGDPPPSPPHFVFSAKGGRQTLPSPGFCRRGLGFFPIV